jgi:hypothetical protein
MMHPKKTLTIQEAIDALRPPSELMKKQEKENPSLDSLITKQGVIKPKE